MGKYDLDFVKLIKDVLPIAVRGNLVEFIYVLIKPIRVIYFRFLDSKQENETKLSYNAQYPNLQRLLNDEIDPDSRGIKVMDSGESIEELLIYPNAELKPIHLGQVLIYPSSRWGYKPFTVLVPQDLSDKESKIKRILDNYKFSGTKYNIEYYE
jgi:hypothetical protein